VSVRRVPLAPVWAAALALLPGPWRTGQDPDASTARSLGRSDAPVTVFELGDFQCPACRQFALTTFGAIREEYVRTWKVRWVFVNFPLPMHRNAVAAALRCMGSGKFTNTQRTFHVRTYSSLIAPNVVRANWRQAGH